SPGDRQRVREFLWLRTTSISPPPSSAMTLWQWLRLASSSSQAVSVLTTPATMPVPLGKSPWTSCKTRSPLFPSSAAFPLSAHEVKWAPAGMSGAASADRGARTPTPRATSPATDTIASALLRRRVRDGAASGCVKDIICVAPRLWTGRRHRRTTPNWTLCGCGPDPCGRRSRTASSGTARQAKSRTKQWCRVTWRGILHDRILVVGRSGVLPAHRAAHAHDWIAEQFVGDRLLGITKNRVERLFGGGDSLHALDVRTHHLDHGVAAVRRVRWRDRLRRIRHRIAHDLRVSAVCVGEGIPLGRLRIRDGKLGLQEGDATLDVGERSHCRPAAHHSTAHHLHHPAHATAHHCAHAWVRCGGRRLPMVRGMFLGGLRACGAI